MKIIKGDQVKVITGKDKGRSGEVIRSFGKKSIIIVKGLNIFKKHLKPAQGKKGGIIEKERPLAVSKVMLICPNCKKNIRVAYLIDKGGKKIRICRKCQSPLTISK